MRRIVLGLCAALLLAAGPATAADIYVSRTTGKKKNAGTKEAPKKSLWRVLSKLKEGDHVYVAEGTYPGQGKSGVMPRIKIGGVTIEGGWKVDFSERDPFRYLSILSPPGDRQGKGGTVFHIELPRKAKRVTLDGFAIDRGPGNYYSADGEPGANKRQKGYFDTSCWGYRAINGKKSGSDPTVIMIGGNEGFTCRNMLLVNNPWWGIYVKGGGDKEIRIENNLILCSKSRALEAITGGGWGKPKWIIRNNTILFTHTFGSDGRALSLDPRKSNGKVLVEKNVFAFSWEGGVTTKFKAKGDSLTLNNNLFFHNRKGDFCVAGSPLCNSDDFEDELEIDTAEDNVHELPKVIAKVAKPWFDRFSIGAMWTLEPFATDAGIMAARAALGLKEFHIPGYKQTFASYKDLPGGRNGYKLSRYPHPMKKGELIDWKTAVVPLIGADGARGIQSFQAGS